MPQVEIVELVVVLMIEHDFAGPAGLGLVTGLRAQHGTFDFAVINPLFDPSTFQSCSPAVAMAAARRSCWVSRSSAFSTLVTPKLEPAREA